MSTQLFPEQASTIAPEIDNVYFGLLGVTAFFTIVIAVAIFYFMFRYRAKSQTAIGEYHPENKYLELIWTIIPTFIGVGLFAWGVGPYLKVRQIPEKALEIAVVGKQWMWKFQHPDGRREINDLHIPIGRPIEFKMISQDVIHSLYIPAFRIKQDVLPMSYTSIWVQPTKLGKFRIFCTEYCGKDHSVMGGWVHVVTPEQYEEFLASDPAAQLHAQVASAAPSTAPARADRGGAAEGKALFTSLGCVACHGETTTGVGPALAGLYGGQSLMADGSSVKADDNYIRESILNPAGRVKKGFQPLMPSYRGRVSEEQILSLISYLKSLRRAE